MECARADLAIVDSGTPWRFEGARGKSRGQNHLFEGAALTGLVRTTIVGGRVVSFEDAEEVKRAYR